MKKTVALVIGVIFVFIVGYQIKLTPKLLSNVITETPKFSLLNKDSLTIKSRVRAPKGYKRVFYKKGSFESYLRHYKLKPYGSKIINYDDTKYYWQQGHIGVLELPVPKNGLQQCADALIRIRSEYLWEKNRKEEIGFNFTSGHYCSWKDYAAGYRPKINGNKVTFSKTAIANHTKENFYNYLNLIYTYSGTLSLYNELSKVNSAKEIKIGDMLIRGGTPGHIVMVCDEVINEEGNKLYLLFQGNTPAQSVHLVKNLSNYKLSPWYNLKLNTKIGVSNYTFSISEYVRFN